MVRYSAQQQHLYHETRLAACFDDALKRLYLLGKKFDTHTAPGNGEESVVPQLMITAETSHGESLIPPPKVATPPIREPKGCLGSRLLAKPRGLIESVNQGRSPRSRLCTGNSLWKRPLVKQQQQQHWQQLHACHGLPAGFYCWAGGQSSEEAW